MVPMSGASGERSSAGYGVVPWVIRVLRSRNRTGPRPGPRPARSPATPPSGASRWSRSPTSSPARSLRWVAPELTGFDLVAIGTGVAAALSAPLLWGLATVSQNKGLGTGAIRVARERQMRAEARRREFATRLSKALDMARNEPDARRRDRTRIEPGRPRRAG